MTDPRAAAELASQRPQRNAASVKTKFYLVIAAVVIVLLGTSFIAKVGLDALSAVRGYVAAESAWSDAQKEAVWELERYVDTGSEAAFDEYRRSLSLPLSLQRARLELESPEPDMAELRRGFTDAGVPLSDVDEMVWLFRSFDSLDHIQAAADIWSRGDEKIAELEQLGLRVRDRVQAGDASPQDLASLRADIVAVHAELDGLTEEFSDSLGASARWAKSLFVRVLVLFTVFGVTVCFVGLVLATRIGTRLERTNRDLTERDRESSGQSIVHEHMQGQQRLEKMLGKMIEFLTEFVGAEVGAVYVQDGPDALRLGSSYGIGPADGLPTRVSLGKGIVGQAARDGRSRLLEDAPVDHLTISTTLSNGRPRHIFVLPLVFDHETQAVVELGAIQPFGPGDVRFLESVARDIALGVQTITARDRVDALLEETQQQAEKLEAQQEELRQTNEELEAQAAALEESQTELEELNTALEEKTEAVEAQTAVVEEKNADLEEARQELEEKARKLETTGRYKSEFLANMSHELRTPLNSVILLSNLLSNNDDGNLTEKQVEFAQTIHSSGSDLLELINEVLDLSKVEAGRMELEVEQVDVANFLSGISRGLEQTAEQKGLSFSVEIADDVPARIETDERRLGQILKNLLSNAIKFTEKGEVRLLVERPDASDAIFAGQPMPPGTSVAFSVIDTGIGMSDEQVPMVFEAFQQAEGSTDRKYGGTGLGLSISRELARVLGGEIFVQSTLGQGSHFAVVLPVTPPSEAAGPQHTLAAAPAVPETAAVASGNTRDGADETPAEPADALPAPYIEDDRREIDPDDRSLLIVEDDRDFARVLLDVARERDFKGLVAEEGRTALRLAEHFMPSAVLLDIGLPDIDGMSIMEQLKANLSTRHIPVHVISAGQRKPEALKKGAVGFLQKPTNVAQLTEAFEKIERILSRPVRRLLIAVGDTAMQGEIEQLIGADDVEIVTVAAGRDALDHISTSTFDCMLLVADLSDMEAADLLRQVRSDSSSPEMPVVVISDEEYSPDVRRTLERYADSVVVKDTRYPERVLDETALFLHRVEKNLPEDKRRMLRSLHDEEAILRDKTVLIVDDDMRNVFALSSTLEEKGMQTMVAKDGRESLHQLDEHAGEIDLVLMDIMMPEMDGYEAMRRIRANPGFDKLPVIALTAKAMRGDRAKCIAAGASDYLSKPVDTDRLLSMLRVWLYQ